MEVAIFHLHNACWVGNAVTGPFFTGIYRVNTGYLYPSCCLLYCTWCKFRQCHTTSVLTVIKKKNSEVKRVHWLFGTCICSWITDQFIRARLWNYLVASRSASKSSNMFAWVRLTLSHFPSHTWRLQTSPVPLTMYLFFCWLTAIPQLMQTFFDCGKSGKIIVYPQLRFFDAAFYWKNTVCYSGNC